MVWNYDHTQRLLWVSMASVVQERMASTSQGEQQEDEEKAALRHHIQQLEEAAARADWESHNLAASSHATDEERLEAALQQEQLQARIRQLEVKCCVKARIVCNKFMHSPASTAAVPEFAVLAGNLPVVALNVHLAGAFQSLVCCTCCRVYMYSFVQQWVFQQSDTVLSACPYRKNRQLRCCSLHQSPQGPAPKTCQKWKKSSCWHASKS